MRLTCPKCAAIYGLAPGLIAPGGQHVQCSACHSRWFVRPDPPAQPVEHMSEEAILARLEARPRGPRPVPAHPAPLPAGPAARAVSAPQHEPGPTRLGGREFAWEAPAEGGRDEMRPRLRVVGGSPSNTEAAASTGTAPPVKTAPGSPADLPSEATTTRPRLELGTPPAGPLAVPAAPPRRFGRGLALGVGLCLMAFGAYHWAEAIGEAVPAAGPYAEAYARSLDDGRLWLEARLGPYLERLREAAGLAE